MKNNIRLVADSEAPSRLLQKHSPARMALAGLGQLAMGFLSDADIEACVAMADATARRYVDVPDHQALPALCALRQHLEAELSDQLGEAAASIVAQAFADAVTARRAELDEEAARPLMRWN